MGELFFVMIFPGLPITIELSGTSKFTKAPGAISTSFPIFTWPITIEFAPITTLFPMMGVPFLFPWALPIKHPWAMLKLSPIIVFGLMTIVPKCPIFSPFPICVPIGI